MPQIDLKLQATADLSGFTKTEAAAQSLERKAKDVSNTLTGMQTSVAAASNTASQAISSTANAAAGMGAAAAAAGRGTSQAMLSAGYQVQDLAIQLAGGQNALRAISQQGSQFLGVFGPTGAIAGAVLAVGALALQFLGVGTSAKEADDKVKKLAESLERLHEKSLTAFRRGLIPVEELKSVNDELEATKKKLSEIEAKRALAIAGISQVTSEVGGDISQLNNISKVNQAGLRKYGITDRDVLGAQSFYNEMLERANTAFDEQTKIKEKIVELTARAQELERSIADDSENELENVEQTAQKYTELADETERYARQLKELDELEANEGAISEEALQAARDILRVKMAMVGMEEKLRIAEAERKVAGPTLAQSNVVTPDQEAAAQAAADAAILAMAQDAARDAIRGAREEVEKFDIQLANLDRNPELSDQEKYKNRVDILNEQTKALQRLKKELEAFAAANPGVDVASLTSTIDRFGKQAADNEGKKQAPQTLTQRDTIALRDLSDPSKHYQSATAGIVGTTQQQFAEMGTGADQIARAYDQAGRSIRSSMGSAFADIVLKGGTMAQRVNRFAEMIGVSFVQTGAQMVADWAYRHTVMAAVAKFFHAQDVTTAIAAEGTKTVAATTGATARTGVAAAEAGTTTAVTVGAAGTQAAATGVAGVFRSIMELGPIAGPLVFAASIAGMIALVSKLAHFEKGGFPEGRNAIVQVNENGQEAILNARATSLLGRDWINSVNAGRLTPVLTPPAFQPPTAQVGPSGGAQPGTQNVAPAVHLNAAIVDSRRAARAIQRGSLAEVQIVEIMQRNKYKIFGRSNG